MNWNFSEDPRYVRWSEQVNRQPSWVLKISIGFALIAVVLPVLILALTGLAVGFVVFLLASVIARVLGLFRTPFSNCPPTNNPRQNVRVIER